MSLRTDKLFMQTFELCNGSLLKVFAFKHLLVKTTPSVARMLFVKFYLMQVRCCSRSWLRRHRVDRNICETPGSNKIEINRHCR